MHGILKLITDLCVKSAEQHHKYNEMSNQIDPKNKSTVSLPKLYLPAKFHKKSVNQTNQRRWKENLLHRGNKAWRRLVQKCLKNGTWNFLKLYSIMPQPLLLTPNYANLFKFAQDSILHSNREQCGEKWNKDLLNRQLYFYLKPEKFTEQSALGLLIHQGLVQRSDQEWCRMKHTYSTLGTYSAWSKSIGLSALCG